MNCEIKTNWIFLKKSKLCTITLIDSVATHFGFERLYDGRSAASTIDQNQSQASWWMGQSVASQNICTGTFAQPNDIFNVQEIQNSDQIFAQCLQRWKRKALHRSNKKKTTKKKKTQSSIVHPFVALFLTCILNIYLSGSVWALSACPGISTWMKHDRSLISVMHGEFTNSWNDESIPAHQHAPNWNEKIRTSSIKMWLTTSFNQGGHARTSSKVRSECMRCER